MKLHPPPVQYSVHRYAAADISRITPSRIMISPGLSVQKFDFVYAEYGRFERYCATKISTMPISTLHCITRSTRSAAERLAIVPAASPKARYDAHGKNGNRPT